MTEVTVQTEDSPVVSFLKDKHELSKLLKSLDKASANAVKLLTETMESTDEKVTLKMKLECADRLLTFYMQASKQVSDDDMTRLLAHVKFGNKQQVLPEGTPPAKPATPKLDFTNIKNV